MVDAYESAFAPVQKLATLRRLQLGPGLVGIRPDRLGEIQEDLTTRLVARLGPGVDSSLCQTLSRIADDQRIVILEHCTEPVAVGAGASGIVEGKQGRCHCGCRGVATATGWELGKSQA